MRRQLFGSVAIPCCVVLGCTPLFFTPFVAEFLPSSSGGQYVLAPGGQVSLSGRLVMGDGLYGNDIEIRVEALPSGFEWIDEPGGSIIRLSNLGPLQSDTFVITVSASVNVEPGSYVITANAEADYEFTVGGGSEMSDDMDFSTTVVVMEIGNGSSPTNCPEYVAHYNGLPCVTEPLVESVTCPKSTSENCDGESDFNTCRIENTRCENGTVVQDLNACFGLLDCGVNSR